MSHKLSLALCALLLTVVAMTPAVHAQDASQLPPLIDRELFFGDPEVAGGQLSPDGSAISFLKPYKGVMNIWVKGLQESFEQARPVTADTARPVMSYFWSRDSKFILYAQDKGGDENYRIYSVDPAAHADSATGVPPARDLTPLAKVRVYIYDVPKKTPQEIIIGLNDRDASYHDVYRLNIASGDRTLLIKNTEKVAGYLFDLESNPRLALRQLPDGGTEFLRVEPDGSLKQIYAVTPEESAGPQQFHKDGKRIYISSNKGKIDLSQLMLLDIATGKTTKVESDPKKEADFGGAIFSDKTDELLATVYVGDVVRIYPRDKQFEKDYTIITKALPNYRISFNSATADESLWLIGASGDTDPGSAYLYSRAAGTVELVYRSRPKLPIENLATMKPVRYKARDGFTIPAYLTIPKGLPPKNLTVVIMPHGGPWARDMWGYNGYTQFLANRGYAVLQPNFRGSTGYGKKFLNAGNKQWGTGAMQHDISDGVQYLIQEGIADPKRVGIFGGSYGGYATLAGLAFTPDLYAAGISFVGPSNIITLLNSIPPYWAPMRKTFAVRVGDMEKPEDLEMLKKQSPLFSAAQIKAPLLVVQGANDPRVKQAESDQIVVTLRDLGRQVEYMLAKNEGHGFARKDNRMAFSAEMEKFFAKHLGGRYQEDVPAELQPLLQEMMVDVSTVTMPVPPDEKAKNAPMPAFNGASVKTGTYQYGMTIEAMGQKFNMDLYRSVTVGTENGRPAFFFTDQQSGMGSESVDTLIADAATLMPIRRTAGAQGMEVLKVIYGKDTVSGFMMGQGGKMDFSVPVTVPVLDASGNIEAAAASLPLEVGYEATLRKFDLLSQKIVALRMTVAAKEKVTVPAGTFDALKIEMKTLDDAKQTETYWIADGIVVKGVTPLPAMMGSGTITTELKKK